MTKGNGEQRDVSDEDLEKNDTTIEQAREVLKDVYGDEEEG